MPVMPAPTTSTSTSAANSLTFGSPTVRAPAAGGAWAEIVPIGLQSDASRHDRKEPLRGNRGSRADGARRALRDRQPRPHPEAALLRRRLLRDGGRAPVAARLADGVPA